MTPVLLRSLYKSKTVHTIAVITSGNLIATVIGAVGSVVQVRYVVPEDMGILRTFAILVGYLTFLHLGVFDGLQREIPYQLGRGNGTKAEEAASACLVWIKFVSLAGVALFLALALWSGFEGEWMFFWGWLSFLPIIVATFYGGYLATTYRTGQQFIMLTKATLWQAIAGCLVLPLLPVLGYYGACLRASVGSITFLYLLHHWRPLRVRSHFNRSAFFEILRIGLPLSVTGYVATSLWYAVESTLVLEMFGLYSLGLFSLAVLVRGLIVQVAQNTNQIMNVKICEQYGRSHRIEDCFRLALRPLTLALLASAPLIAIGWFATPPLVKIVAPKYIEATSIAQWMLLTLPLSFLQVMRLVVRAAGRWIDCAISDAVGLPIFIGSSYLLYYLGYGVESVVFGSLLGLFISLATTIFLVRRLVRREISGFPNAEESILCLSLRKV